MMNKIIKNMEMKKQGNLKLAENLPEQVKKHGHKKRSKNVDK